MNHLPMAGTIHHNKISKKSLLPLQQWNQPIHPMQNAGKDKCENNRPVKPQQNKGNELADAC